MSLTLGVGRKHERSHVGKVQAQMASNMVLSTVDEVKLLDCIVAYIWSRRRSKEIASTVRGICSIRLIPKYPVL